MPSTIDITKEVQEKVLESMKVGQRAVVDSVRSWASTAETIFSRFPDFVTAEPTAKPNEYFQSAASFAERALASQREFVQHVYEAFVPAARAAANAGPQSAKAGTAKVS
jgi:hypothetical protein